MWNKTCGAPKAPEERQREVLTAGGACLDGNGEGRLLGSIQSVVIVLSPFVVVAYHPGRCP